MAVLQSNGVLVAGVTILSLKSSAKSSSDPYTVSTEPEDGMRMQPRQRLSGGGGGETETSHEPVTAKRPVPQRSRSSASASNPPVSGGGEREVMWEVGSVSSDEDEPSEKKDGAEGDRIGLGIKGAGGERRGLLFGDEEEEQGALEVTEIDIERRRRDTQNDEEGFGEFESIPRPGPDRP